MSNNLYLFANNNGEQAENKGNYRLYDMKVEGVSEGVESGVNYVDCLIGDGASYIDTGIIGNNKYKYEIIFEDYTINTYEKYFGVYSLGKCSLSVQRSGSIDSFDINYNKLYQWVSGYSKGERVKLYIDANKVYKNDNLVLTMDEPTETLSYGGKTFLFDGNQHDVYSDMRCFSFKTWDENKNLVQDLRPCLDTQGVPCMHDEVSKKYFYNKGTGTFGFKKTLREFQPVLDSNNIPCLLDKTNRKYYYNKGTGVFDIKEKPKYKKLKYIQGDRDNYINIENQTINQDSIIEVGWKVLDTSAAQQCFLFDKKYALQRGSNSILYLYNSLSSSSVRKELIYDVNANKHDIKISKDKFIFDEQEVDLVSLGYPQTYSFTGILNLFYYTEMGQVYDGKSGISYFKLYESDQLVLDLIPVLDENNIPCMYDLVSETFFYNQGTGTFGYEVEELDAPQADYVDYLESTGTQYIDTGIPVSSNTSYEITASSSDNNAYVFGVSGDYNVGRTELFLNKNLCIPAMFSGGYKRCEFTNKDEYTKHNIVMTPTQLFIDNVEISEPSWGSILPSTKYTMYLFGYNSYDGVKCYKYRVYEFKTYNGEELIQDLRPCLDSDGTPCMYDLVSETFFYNQGTGTFEYGERIGYTEIEYIESNGTQYIDTEVVPTSNTDIDMTCRACDYSETPTLTNAYIMNGLQINNNIYQYNDTDTTVQPNLVASEGATLTMGSTNLALLDDEDIEIATNNGWSIV